MKADECRKALDDLAKHLDKFRDMEDSELEEKEFIMLVLERAPTEYSGAVLKSNADAVLKFHAIESITGAN